MSAQENRVALNKDNYIIIKNAVPKEVCELLSEYAKLKADIKPNIRKKDALSGIHREYGDPMMETLLAKLTPQVEQVTGLNLWPTLSFYYTYKNGDALAPHKDRNSCQYVAGLCIGVDADYENRHGSWPLVMKVNGQADPVALEAGDMVIFKGNEIEHWRNPFEGTWFVSAIFGYVDQHGPYAYQKFDQRKSLGIPHVGMFRWLLGCIKGSIKYKLFSRAS